MTIDEIRQIIEESSLDELLKKSILDRMKIQPEEMSESNKDISSILSYHIVHLRSALQQIANMPSLDPGKLIAWQTHQLADMAKRALQLPEPCKDILVNLSHYVAKLRGVLNSIARMDWPFSKFSPSPPSINPGAFIPNGAKQLSEIAQRALEILASCNVREGILICDLSACVELLAKQKIEIRSDEDNDAAEQYLKDHFKKVLGERDFHIMTEDYIVLY